MTILNRPQARMTQHQAVALCEGANAWLRRLTMDEVQEVLSAYGVESELPLVVAEAVTRGNPSLNALYSPASAQAAQGTTFVVPFVDEDAETRAVVCPANLLRRIEADPLMWAELAALISDVRADALAKGYGRGWSDRACR